MFDTSITPHEHIGDKKIRNDSLEDFDGISYTLEELQELRVSENPIDYGIPFSIDAIPIDADNDGIFVNIKKSGVEESVQIG